MNCPLNKTRSAGTVREYCSSNGTVSYDRADFNWLDDGQQVDYTITFHTKSGDDAEQTQTIHVVINGQEDAAQVTVASPAADTESDTSAPVSFTLASTVTAHSDADSADATFVPYVTDSGTVASVSGPNPPSGTLDDLLHVASNGTVSYDRADFNWLDDGQQVDYTITFHTKSGDDAEQTQTIHVVINGQEDAAQVTVASPAADTESDTSAPVSFTLASTVTAHSDADSADATFVPYVTDSGTVASVSGPNPPSGTLDDLLHVASNGTVSYDRADFNWLDDGQQVDYTITFHTKSGDDAEQTQTIHVVINGQEDAAQVTVASPAADTESDTSAPVSFTLASTVTAHSDADSAD